MVFFVCALKHLLNAKKRKARERTEAFILCVMPQGFFPQSHLLGRRRDLDGGRIKRWEKGVVYKVHVL